MKKFLSWLLCLVMLFSMIPASAFAEEDCAHEWGEWETTTEPTCSEEGEQTRACSLCGDTETETLEKLEHTPVDVEEVPPAVGVPGKTAGVVCAVCGEVLEGCEVIEALVEETASEEKEPEDERVRVRFECEPKEAEITIYVAVEVEEPAESESKGEEPEKKWTVALDENDEPVVIKPEEDGSRLLLPGVYLYDAACEGYESVEKAELTVKALEEGETEQKVAVELKAVEEPAEEPAEEESDPKEKTAESEEKAADSEEQSITPEEKTPVSEEKDAKSEENETKSEATETKGEEKAAENNENETKEEEKGGKTEETPVRVEFVCEPKETAVTVYKAEKNEEDELVPALDEKDEPVVIAPEKDGAYLLLPGTYLYDAFCAGYTSVEKAELTFDKTNEGIYRQSINLLPNDTLITYSKVTSSRNGSNQIITENYLWPNLTRKGVNAYYLDPDYGYGTHYGLDLNAQIGDIIVATLSGEVVVVYDGCVNNSSTMSCYGKNCDPHRNGKSNPTPFTGGYKNTCNSGYGNGVVIYHGTDSSGRQIYSQYAHMTSIDTENIYAGAKVARGQPLGTAGSTGYSAGVHAHFQLSTSQYSDGSYSINNNPVGNPRGPAGTIVYDMTLDPTQDAEDIVITAYDATNVTCDNATLTGFVHFGTSQPIPTQWGVDCGTSDSNLPCVIFADTSKQNITDTSGTGCRVSFNFVNDGITCLLPNTTYYYRIWTKYDNDQFAHSEIKQFTTPKNAPSLTKPSVNKYGSGANNVKISSTITWPSTALPVEWGVDISTTFTDESFQNVATNFSREITEALRKKYASGLPVSLDFATETAQVNMLQAGTTYGYRLWVRYQVGSNDRLFEHSEVGTFTTPGTASTATTYTLAFDSNGGSGSMSSLQVAMNQSFTVPNCSFTKSGYTFKNWNVKRSDGKWYVNGQGWLTETQITNGGYTKAEYAGRCPTFNSSWTNGCSNPSFTFVAQWTKDATSVAVTGVSLNKSSLSLAAGKSEKLTATVSPSNATNKSVTWTSSNTAAATVASDGTVTGVKAGTATITVKTADGNKTATCAVTVTAPSITVTLETYSSSYPMKTDTTATVRHKLKVSGISVNDLKKANNGVGCELYDSTGNTFLGRAQDISSSSTPITVNSGGYVDTFYTIGSGKELNYALAPNTTYKYRFYAVYSGERYYSAYQDFTTTGTSPTVAKTETYNGHTYERYDASISWTEAKSFCESKGGHLVTIMSEAENNWIMNTLLSGCTKNYYWIGGSDAETEGTWKWVTGETFWTGGMNGSVKSGYVAYWDPQAPEPNDRNGENYAGIMGKNVGTNKQIGEWIDVYNGGDTGNSDYALSKSGFVCEYEPQKPDTPTVTTNKSSYTVGENVTISWTAVARNENYTLTIYKDGSSLYSGSQGQSNSYTLNTPAVGSYEACVTAANSGGQSGLARCTFTVEPVKYRLDLNAALDGENTTSLGGYGVADVYINGQLVQASCSDYCVSWPTGTSYEIKNIRPAEGRSYDGLSTGSSARSGTTNDNRYVRLAFHTCPDSIDETPVTALYNGHTYRFFSTAVTWYDAKHLCEAMGGHLATITSAEENSFVTELVGNAGAWLGGTDIAQEGSWQWLTGEAFAYTNWSEGEPNNAAQSGEEKESYLQIGANDTRWNDVAGYKLFPFVCEFDFVLGYPVAYEGNGGTGTPGDQTKLHDTPLALSDTIPTRADTNDGNHTVTLNPNGEGASLNPTTLTAASTTSYSFKGWNTKVDGSGTGYASGVSYTANEALTLYAQWEKTTTVASVVLPSATLDSHIFLGWSTSADAPEAEYAAGDSIKVEADTTLFAVWEALIPYGRVSGLGANLADAMDFKIYVKDVDPDVTPSFAVTLADRTEKPTLRQAANNADYAASGESVYTVDWDSTNSRWIIRIKMFPKWISSSFSVQMTDADGNPLYFTGYAYDVVGSTTVAVEQSYSFLDYLQIMSIYKGGKYTQLYNQMQAYGELMKNW